eukprot:scaffold224304_cov18-Tisochrysis_lutea.AAC.1
MQGLVLDCSPLAFTHLDKLPPADAVMKEAAAAGAPPPVWVALDEVLDPVSYRRGLAYVPAAAAAAATLANPVQGCSSMLPTLWHTAAARFVRGPDVMRTAE